MKWKRIATAPKDGTPVILHCQSPHVKPDATDVNTVIASWWEGEEGDEGAWVCYMDMPSDPVCPFDPTHWMPLPRPPQRLSS